MHSAPRGRRGKKASPGEASQEQICDFFHVFLAAIQSSVFIFYFFSSQLTAGTCCERGNTMLPESHPGVDYVSPHSVKDG